MYLAPVIRIISLTQSRSRPSKPVKVNIMFSQGRSKLKKVFKRVIRSLADAQEVQVHNGQHVVDGALIIVGVVLDVNTYLAGRGKWMAFHGGKTTLLTTISFNQ